MHERTEAILRLLKDSGGHVSGDVLGRACAVSRAAVWKHIGLLRDQGYRIEACRTRGYRLAGTVNAPLACEVAPLLRTATIGRRLEHHEVVDSTNRVAGELARAGAAEGTTVVAERQSAGRGRRGRTWCSPPGRNLYVSLLLRPAVHPARVAQLPLVAAAAVHRALAACVPAVALGIKWPNDLLAKGGAKVAGILCEAGSEADVVQYAVVGIGINVNGVAFPPELDGIATSLEREGGAELSRPLLLAAVLNAFEEDYRRWLADGSLAGFLPYLEEHSALRGRAVTIEGSGGGRTGRAAGLTEDGALLLRDARGRVTAISAGDVTIGSAAKLPNHGGPE